MLLSILVPLAEAICLIRCRNQEYSKELVYAGVMPEMMQEINVATYLRQSIFLLLIIIKKGWAYLVEKNEKNTTFRKNKNIKNKC